MSDITKNVLAQYEKNKASMGGQSKFASQEERFKKFFAAILPKGERSGEKRIRILPTKDGSTPFKEVRFHELQVGGTWTKLYDPAQDGKRSPLNEVHEALMATGEESDKELARSYRSRTYYIVKIIDRDNEQDGVKFWRFKHNSKGEGVLDKIEPIFRKKGNITDVTGEEGRDLILSLNLNKANNGKEYTVISSIIPEDKEPLSTDPEQLKEWVEDDLTWRDVYAIKSEEYLDMIANGETPRWDNDLKKYVSDSSSTEEATIGNKSSEDEEIVDPQQDEEPETDDELPF